MGKEVKLQGGERKDENYAGIINYMKFIHYVKYIIIRISGLRWHELVVTVGSFPPPLDPSVLRAERRSRQLEYEVFASSHVLSHDTHI